MMDTFENSIGNKLNSKAYHQAVVNKGVIYVIDGSDGKTSLHDVWSSKDGATWTEVKANGGGGFSKRCEAQSVVLPGVVN